MLHTAKAQAAPNAQEKDMAGGNRVKPKGAFCGPRPPKVLARSSPYLWNPSRQSQGHQMSQY